MVKTTAERALWKRIKGTIKDTFTAAKEKVPAKESQREDSECSGRAESVSRSTVKDAWLCGPTSSDGPTSLKRHVEEAFGMRIAHAEQEAWKRIKGTLEEDEGPSHECDVFPH